MPIPQCSSQVVPFYERIGAMSNLYTGLGMAPGYTSATVN